jgi:predicted Zn-dependent protease with MMP-like domain
VEIDRTAFEGLVADAMDQVPEPFASALDEVAVVVEDRAPREMGQLYGLYHGVPLTAGAPHSGQLPAHITIYMHPMIDHYGATGDIVEQVRITVLHELGHHLGLDEDDLDRLGYA